MIFSKIKNMNKALLLLAFILCSFPLSAAMLTRGPYIEDPTQTTMVLYYQTDEPTPSWLEYGPSPRCNQIMTMTPSGTSHKAILYGLVPNQDYCYRLYVYNAETDGVQNPVEGSFRTLYSPERKIVKFLAFGNTAGDNLPLKQTLADKMAAHDTDFVLHTGNLTASGLNEDANGEFFNPYKKVLAKNPLFIAVGPNEYGPERDSRDSRYFFRSNFSQFHNMSWGGATPKYYSFDTANARFIFLDTNVADNAVWAPEIGPDSKQTKWLKTTLAGAADGQWKVVVMNAPAYSTGANGANNQIYANWASIFEQYRVNLVIQGGEASYERTFPMYKGEPNPRGVTYITLGGGGPLPTKRASSDPSTARFVANNHYAKVEIVDRRLTLKVFNETDKQIDTLDLYM